MASFNRNDSLSMWQRGFQLLKEERQRKKVDLPLKLELSNKSVPKSSSGFSAEPNKLFIIDNCTTKTQPISSLDDVQIVHLPYYMIRSIGAFQDCRNLTICILHNNSIALFSSLVSCPLLKRIDLHSNQICDLPDERFWKAMKQLRVVNLHDNKIDGMSNVEAIAECSTLTALTMYETPLSLHSDYRHVMVNAIWSLKALDHYVIGDDEVIEEVTFAKRFRAQNPSLFVDLCPDKAKLTVISTLRIELDFLRKILTDINETLKHGSPVIIIQRWLRGHLCRKKLGVSYFQINQKLRQHVRSADSKASETNKKKVYTKDFSVDQFKLMLSPDLLIDFERLYNDIKRAYTQSPSDDVVFHVLNDSVLLSQPRMWKILMADDKQSAVARLSQIILPVRSPFHEEIIRKKQMEKEMLEYYDVFNARMQLVDEDLKFLEVFNPLVSNSYWRVHTNDIYLLGKKSTFSKPDHLTEKLTMCRKSGVDVRSSIDFWHIMKILQTIPKVCKPKRLPKLRDEFPLSLLKSIETSYKVKKLSHRKALKAVRMAEMEEEKIKGRCMAVSFLKEKRVSAVRFKRSSKDDVEEAGRLLESERARIARQVREHCEESLKKRLVKDDEREFASYFNQDMVSVSNALHKHQRQTTKVKRANDKKYFTTKIKAELAAGQLRLRHSAVRDRAIKQLRGKNDNEIIKQVIAQAAQSRLVEASESVNRQRAQKAAGFKFFPFTPPVSKFSSLSISPQQQRETPKPQLSKTLFDENQTDEHSLCTYYSFKVTRQKSKVSSVST